jgi:hypothetical protein
MGVLQHDAVVSARYAAGGIRWGCMRSYLYFVFATPGYPEAEASGALSKFREDVRRAMAAADPEASVDQAPTRPDRKNTRAVGIRTNLTITPLEKIVQQCARDNRLSAYQGTPPA